MTNLKIKEIKTKNSVEVLNNRRNGKSFALGQKINRNTYDKKSVIIIIRYLL